MPGGSGLQGTSRDPHPLVGLRPAPPVGDAALGAASISLRIRPTPNPSPEGEGECFCFQASLG